jgi:hypothetical protein
VQEDRLECGEGGRLGHVHGLGDGSVAGLVGAPLLYLVFAPLPAPRIDAQFGALAVAGLLVGIGHATAPAA